MGARLVSYTPSKTLYALHWMEKKVTPVIERPGLFRVEVPAIWTVTKHGNAQITSGHITEYLIGEITMDAFCGEISSLHGGAAEAKWDGDYLWAPQTTLKEMNRLAKVLDPMLRALPEVPPGHEGWYSLK